MRFSGVTGGGGGEQGRLGSLPTLGLSQSTMRNAIKVRAKASSSGCRLRLRRRPLLVDVARRAEEEAGAEAEAGAVCAWPASCMMYGSAGTTLRIRNARSTRGRLRCNPFARQRSKGGAAAGGGAAAARAS